MTIPSFATRSCGCCGRSADIPGNFRLFTIFSMTVQAMKGGAIEFLTKPFRDQDLLDAVEAGLARDRLRQESERALAMLRERFDTLSSREREIMLHVVAGRLNKQIANDIGIAESTVKVHRTHLMRKMKARSLPELSRMADTLNVRLQ
jgi:FixJ family two-component response regulator